MNYSERIILAKAKGRARERFLKHRMKWDSCEKCPVGKQATNHVFYRGVIPCKVLFIGEAPGETEDLKGYPFIGRSGELLDRLIRDTRVPHYAITNTLCCRPTVKLTGGNRPPSNPEIDNCAPRLEEFIRIADPKVFVTLGRHAADWIRERREKYKQPWLDLYHPSYVLRCGGLRGSVYNSERKRLLMFLGRLT